eukprot:3701356-Rhodomonas_salina.1
MVTRARITPPESGSGYEARHGDPLAAPRLASCQWINSTLSAPASVRAAATHRDWQTRRGVTRFIATR